MSDDTWRYLAERSSYTPLTVGDTRIRVTDVTETDEEIWASVRDEFLDNYYREMWEPNGVPDSEAKTRDVLDTVREQDDAFCLIGIEEGNGAAPEPVGNYMAFSPRETVLEQLHYPEPMRQGLQRLEADGLSVGYDFHLVVHPDRRESGIGRFLAETGQELHDTVDVTVATIRYGNGDTPIYRMARDHFDYDHTGLAFDGGRTVVMYREDGSLDADVDDLFPAGTNSESV